jgi:hypothetical protein
MTWTAQSFVSKTLPAISAAWLNSIDVFWGLFSGAANIAQLNAALQALIPVAFSGQVAAGTTAAISTGTAIAHGLSTTPVAVVITQVGATPVSYSVSSLNSSGFTINFTGGGTQQFCWRAQTALGI